MIITAPPYESVSTIAYRSMELVTANLEQQLADLARGVFEEDAAVAWYSTTHRVRNHLSGT